MPQYYLDMTDTITASPSHTRESARSAAIRRAESELRLQYYSHRTVEAYLGWIRRFLAHHARRDPLTLDPEAARSFLSVLAERHRVGPTTQNQARSALVFFYRHVVGAALAPLEGITPASRPRRVPVVLSRDEVASVLRGLRGAKQLVAMILYGSGLRLMEALTLA